MLNSPAAIIPRLGDVVDRYRLIFERAPDAIFVVDARRPIDRANAQTERAVRLCAGRTGRPPVELLIPPRLREGHAAHRAELLVGAAPAADGPGTDAVRPPQGRQRVPGRLMLSPCGRRRVLRARVARDLNERQRADELFRGLLEAAPDAMVIVDEGGEIVLVNSQTESLFGYSRRAAREARGDADPRTLPRAASAAPRRLLGRAARAADGRGLELYGLARTAPSSRSRSA